MKRLTALITLLVVCVPNLVLAASSVAVHHGNVVCKRADGTRLSLTRHGGYSQTTLSPDGYTTAFIHDDKSEDTPDGRAGALWIGNCRTAVVYKALPAQFKGQNDNDGWASLGQPVFSPRGRYVYAGAYYGGDGGLIQRFDIRTGQHTFAFNGELVALFRNGPHRGYLLATQHTDLTDAQGQHYGGYPLYIFRPDGTVVERIAGSERWGEKDIKAWLKSKGWKAW